MPTSRIDRQLPSFEVRACESGVRDESCQLFPAAWHLRSRGDVYCLPWFAGCVAAKVGGARGEGYVCLCTSAGRNILTSG